MTVSAYGVLYLYSKVYMRYPRNTYMEETVRPLRLADYVALLPVYLPIESQVRWLQLCYRVLRDMLM